MAKQKVLIIVGPTSSGKSALAVRLARRFDGEIISADSRQVYRRLNIGTGKITKHEMHAVKHHLLDIAPSNRIFTAHDFVEHARAAIESIAARGKLPIVAGGTGFYIDALLGRIALPNVPLNAKLRARFEKRSAAQLFALLKKRDAARAKTIEPHNKRRLIRALEILEAVGHVPMMDLRNPSFDARWVGIAPPMKTLTKKIIVRLRARIRAGMIKEAKQLHKAGLSYRRMEQLGLEYRALAQLLRKKVSRAEFEEKLAHDIRRYAKRQTTYWKRNKDVHWFYPRQSATIVMMIKKWLKH